MQRSCHVSWSDFCSVHPDDTPFNEAWEMRAFLLQVQLLPAFLERTLTHCLPFPPLQHGVPEDMIIGDFYARHTTTNLRNVCACESVCGCVCVCVCVCNARSHPTIAIIQPLLRSRASCSHTTSRARS
jgi:hypothetical protein